MGLRLRLVRVTQLVFGPYTPFPVEFRVMGPDPAQLYAISDRALYVMRGVPDVRQANRDWGNRTPVLRFIPDQDRLNLIGLSSAEWAGSCSSSSLASLLRRSVRTSAMSPSWHAAQAASGWIQRVWRISH
jgi:Cation/multidrug efflux pump